MIEIEKNYFENTQKPTTLGSSLDPARLIATHLKLICAVSRFAVISIQSYPRSSFVYPTWSKNAPSKKSFWLKLQIKNKAINFQHCVNVYSASTIIKYKLKSTLKATCGQTAGRHHCLTGRVMGSRKASGNMHKIILFISFMQPACQLLNPKLYSVHCSQRIGRKKLLTQLPSYLRPDPNFVHCQNFKNV